MEMPARFSVRGRLALDSDIVPGALIVDAGRLEWVLRGRHVADLPAPVLEASYVFPGFVDLQVNGGFGVTVGDDPEAFRTLARRLPETGVTAFLPTAVTAPSDAYPRIFDAFEASRDAPGARMPGLHLEGPYLSPQRPGAHRRDLIERADPKLLDELLEGRFVRLMTLAPERPSALDMIRRLREQDIVVALGHTDASYEQFEAGIDAGATIATHLFNAMSPFHHRALGAIGAVLVDYRVTTTIIPDGVHTAPDTLELALRAKGSDRLVPITDMTAAGMDDGTHTLGGRKVTVDGGVVRLEDGTIAGSTLAMDQGIRNLLDWTHTTPGDVARMAADTPARLLGLGNTGRLAPGVDADFILLDEDLRVQQTFVQGKRVHPLPRDEIA